MNIIYDVTQFSRQYGHFIQLKTYNTHNFHNIFVKILNTKITHLKK